MSAIECCMTNEISEPDSEEYYNFFNQGVIDEKNLEAYKDFCFIKKYIAGFNNELQVKASEYNSINKIILQYAKEHHMGKHECKLIFRKLKCIYASPEKKNEKSKRESKKQVKTLGALRLVKNPL